MSPGHLSLWNILVRTAVVHTLTYTAVGIVAFTVIDYPALFAEADLRGVMRPTDDPLVMAGPLFQPIRGLLFGVVFSCCAISAFSKSAGG